MNVKDLISVLSKLPDDSEVKMYLFTPVPAFPSRVEGPSVMSCLIYDLHDVLIATYGNQVLLSSHE